MRFFPSETHEYTEAPKPTLARRNRFAPPGYWLTQRGNFRQLPSRATPIANPASASSPKHSAAPQAAGPQTAGVVQYLS